MRDKNGFIDISDYLDLGETKEGKNKPRWLSNEKNEYIFKIVKGIYLYRELFYATILKNIKMNTVENDLAIYNDQKGLLSKSYRPYKMKAYSFCDIIEAYCEEKRGIFLNYDLEKELSNTRDMVFILKWFCETKQQPFEETAVKHEIFLSFIMSILLANADDCPTNMEIYFKDKLYLSPYYDFEYFGDIHDLDKHYSNNSYSLWYRKDTLDKSPTTFKGAIKDFKNYSTKEELTIFLNYLETLQTLKIKEQFEETEDKIHAYIPKRIKCKLRRDYTTNLINVKSVINDKD